jgi:3-phosphoshikimate 1-carboxyvinyltransferase
MISSVAGATTVIRPFLHSDDTLATLECVKKLGVSAELKGRELIVRGQGRYFSCTEDPVFLDARESGTTMRILSGLLVGQRFSVRFQAGPSLERRPMGRIISPLRRMGAEIRGTIRGSLVLPPLEISPVRRLSGLEYELPIPSAQLKSSLLLAGLYAEGPTSIIEPAPSRDHTERMLRLFNAALKVEAEKITLKPGDLSSPGKLYIPGDFSSAAFFIVLGLILEGSSLLIRNVNINPTRCGLLEVLKRMGAHIEIQNQGGDYEPYADIMVKSSSLGSTTVRPQEIPLVIDEVPVLCVAAAFARGRTEIQGLKELRVKETDRVKSMVDNLAASGVDIRDESWGDDDTKLVINGAREYKPAAFQSRGDHRTAMSLIVFAAGLKGQSSIDDIDCINKSFPDFSAAFESLYEPR